MLSSTDPTARESLAASRRMAADTHAPCRGRDAHRSGPASLWIQAAATFLLAWLVLMSPAMAGAAGPLPAAASGDGARLFMGRTPLPARMRGHAQDLPPPAARCSNCHQDKPARTQIRSGLDVARNGTTGREAPGSFAPLLDRQRLLSEQARRGGPPSRFDALSFCRLLREGMDPALVMVDASMPRYQISDAQCSALWSHLTRS